MITLFNSLDTIVTNKELLEWCREEYGILDIDDLYNLDASSVELLSSKEDSLPRRTLSLATIAVVFESSEAMNRYKLTHPKDYAALCKLNNRPWSDPTYGSC